MLELKRLYDQTLITSTSAIRVITNPSDTETVILEIHVKNNGENNVTCKLYQVPDNASALGTLVELNHKFSEIILYPDGQYGSENTWKGKRKLEDENDALYIQVSEASVITCEIEGLQG